MQSNSLLRCTKKDQWNNRHIGFHNNGPKWDDIVTHNGDDGGIGIFLLEYPLCPCGCGIPRSFDRKYFTEIQPPMTIDISELQHQTQTV